ncbi:hypothetical protein V8C86DRAFT_473681 [Haematococcus lacustris]
MATTRIGMRTTTLLCSSVRTSWTRCCLGTTTSRCHRWGACWAPCSLPDCVACAVPAQGTPPLANPPQDANGNTAGAPAQPTASEAVKNKGAKAQRW